MKNIFFLIAILATQQAWTQNKNNDYRLRNLAVGYEDHYDNATTRNEGTLFELPDTNSKVIWQHKNQFQTHITPLKKAKNQGLKWYKVAIEDGTQGFLREQDFVKYSFYGQSHTYYYFVNSPKAKDKSYPYYKVIKKKYKARNQVLTEKQRHQKWTDTFELGMYWSYLRAKAKYQKIALKGVQKLFHLEFFNAQCPGTTETVLLVDVKDSLSIIASSFSQGEAGWSEYRVVYLPVKFGNDKVLLVANGDVENIFNTQTAELNTFDYPKDIGIPIEELVVIVEENYEPIEADRQDEDSYKDPETKRTLYKEEYYRWADNKLVKIKEK